jgi:hypothetical protein
VAGITSSPFQTNRHMGAELRRPQMPFSRETNPCRCPSLRMCGLPSRLVRFDIRLGSPAAQIRSANAPSSLVSCSNDSDHGEHGLRSGQLSASCRLVRRNTFVPPSKSSFLTALLNLGPDQARIPCSRQTDSRSPRVVRLYPEQLTGLYSAEIPRCVDEENGSRPYLSSHTCSCRQLL